MSDGGSIIFPTRNPAAYQGVSIKASAAFAANVGATSILGTAPRKPTRIYRLDVQLLITTLATLAANAAFNVISTDQIGAFTAPVPLCGGVSGVFAASVNIGAGGVQRASGSLIFQNLQTFNVTAVDVSISITGITTPGPLAGTWTAILTPIG